MRVEVPSRTDEVAAQASQVIGGPVGRYARVGGRGWLPAAAVLSALASVVVALGVLQKNHCVRSGWATPNSLWRMCYSDLPAAANGSAPASPYSGGGPGGTQPVLTAVLTWVLQRVTPGSGLARQQWYFGLSALGIVVLVAACVCAIAWVLPSRPWRAALVALSPLLVTSALVSLDLLGVALTTLGLAAWLRRYPVAAGALLGAGVMARSFPLVVIAAVVLVGWRAGQRAEIHRLLLAALGVVLVSLALAYALGGDPLAPYRIWNGQGATYGSVWLVTKIAGLDLSAGILTSIAALGWVVALALGAYLAVRPRPVSVVPVATVMLVVVLLTGKSNPVQSVLWLLPLVAASLLPWRDYLAWVALEVAAFAGTWLYVGHGFDANKSLPAEAYAVLTVIRLLGLIALAWRILTLDEQYPERAAAPVAPPRHPQPVD